MLLWKLTKAFLFHKRKEAFIPINSVLCMLGVAVSILVLTVVLAVMQGFGHLLQEKIISMNPHVVAYQEGPFIYNDKEADLFKNNKMVKATTPFMKGHAVLEYNGKIYGIQIRSIQAGVEEKSFEISRYLKMGSKVINKGEILIGTELAKRMQSQLGDKVIVYASNNQDNDNFPDELEFSIAGIYESGLHDYDLTGVFIPLEQAQLLFGFRKKVHALGIALHDPMQVQAFKSQIPSQSTNWSLRTWLETNKAFLSAIKTEKNMMFVLLAFAVLIASFNILSTLVMMVMEKRRDIGILKSLGMNRYQIMSLFLMQGLLIGGIGMIIGTICALSFVDNIDYLDHLLTKLTGLEVFPRDTYYLDKIPTHLQIKDVIKINLLCLFVTLTAAIYPAIKAASLLPSKVLRND